LLPVFAGPVVGGVEAGAFKDDVAVPADKPPHRFAAGGAFGQVGVHAVKRLKTPAARTFIVICRHGFTPPSPIVIKSNHYKYFIELAGGCQEEVPYVWFFVNLYLSAERYGSTAQDPRRVLRTCEGDF
jgi:hypothetical protein